MAQTGPAVRLALETPNQHPERQAVCKGGSGCPDFDSSVDWELSKSLSKTAK